MVDLVCVRAVPWNDWLWQWDQFFFKIQTWKLVITFLISSYREKIYYLHFISIVKKFLSTTPSFCDISYYNWICNIDMYHFIKASHYPTLFGRSWYSARKRLLARWVQSIVVYHRAVCRRVRRLAGRVPLRRDNR